MAKKSFMYMSSNEWLGDSVTHFMKTGNALRSDENDNLVNISALIPKQVNGVKVEYDISYESPKDRVHGYKYTDMLTKVVTMASGLKRCFQCSPESVAVKCNP